MWNKSESRISMWICLLFLINPLGEVKHVKASDFAKPADLYEDAYSKAQRDQNPLVIFVRVPCRNVPGCVCVRYDDYLDGDEQAVIVGKPQGKDRKFEAITLPREATDTVIRRAGGIHEGSGQIQVVPMGRCGQGG